MADLSIAHVRKRFGEFEALKDVSLHVADGEFVAVLGPSGCGKTTLLRTIAGFEAIDSGTITIGSHPVSSAKVHVAPEHRNIGIVFQSYALWPHMSVAENVGYGLKVARVPDAERTRRVRDALALVGLTGLETRPPAMLSGGQRQRVALARCLVTSPTLVLLDEPLANLDVHLRASMEDEFADFHKRTGTTMFYITHDQAEAMALADRIVVMDHGVVMQIATPEELFRRPATEMVAQFIGQGLIVPANVRSVGGGRCMVQVLGADIAARCSSEQRTGDGFRLCVRPRELQFSACGDGFACRVTRVIYQGGYYRVEVMPEADPNLRFVIHRADDQPIENGDLVNVVITDGWIIPHSVTATSSAIEYAAA
ncbi:ABC transporter ATP-binding protein [Microvirga rosea]|uniref:ABC transporter ATP-binding protein n=1 Tax=Microvirga rosea TaxID=2715425 RepID=UPI001D0A2021|nr:ABC transporter ATP-binding protein [Microvirga rosea]MCB8823507.1 ABC transporter ATP-binding protein [Microvirga rosea]